MMVRVKSRRKEMDDLGKERDALELKKFSRSLAQHLSSGDYSISALSAELGHFGRAMKF